MPADQMVQPPVTAMKKCRQITELISHKADRPLTGGERLALHLHLLICPQCREYARQIELVQQAVKKFKL